MTIWALADLHLAFGAPDKSMDVFGEPWTNYTVKIKKHWEELVKHEDLVLLAGDISWAMRPLDAKVDLDWIHALPGTKVLLRGNHDYWWTSLKQIEQILPPSMHLIQNNAWKWNGYVIGGTRLWDTPEYAFGPYIRYADNPRAKKMSEEDSTPDAEKIFERELGRLELSLKAMEKLDGERLVMTHYPPISADLHPSRASALLEKYKIKTCVFGHLHNIRENTPLFGEKNGIHYHLTSADYLHFKPIRIT